MATRFDQRRFFTLVWLAFLVYPVFALFAKPRSLIEYLYGGLLLFLFIALFLWVYLLSPLHEHEFPLRRSSALAVLGSYATLLLMFPLIGWNGVGLTIYAAAFAGTQRSYVLSTIVIAVNALLLFLLVFFAQFDVFLALTMFVFTLAAAIGNHISYRELEAQIRLQRAQDDVAMFAKIAERERIARDLHDLLGHTLSVIVLKSELASRLSDKNPAKATLEIQEVERIARDALQEVRAAVRGYRSAGLEAELGNARLACEAAGIVLELALSPTELSWQCEQALALALREAVTNTIRHANAKTLWVSLTPRDTSVALSVRDDGSGRIEEGNGIRGIRERLSVLGGQLEFDAQAKGLTAIVPVVGA
ncbi:MAG: sensor histidine kinase [Deinococcales bacterium]